MTTLRALWTFFFCDDGYPMCGCVRCGFRYRSPWAVLQHHKMTGHK